MTDDGVTWTFVWQGTMTEDEAVAFAEHQPDRVPLYDCGLWLSADPERCEKDGHVPRLHPDESWQSYCVICGAYPVDNPELLRALTDPELQARAAERYAVLFGDDA